MTLAVCGPRRLELDAFYAPATTRLVTTRRHLTPSGSSSLAIVTTPLERLPPGLSQARLVELDLTLSLTLTLQNTTALLLHCVHILCIRILYITLRVTPGPLRIQSYSRDFDSACWHQRTIHGVRQQAPSG